MTTHQLRTFPTAWDAVQRGDKTFELRLNDRCFQKGDFVELIRLAADDAGAEESVDAEGDPRTLVKRIGWILHAGFIFPGLEADYCILSLLDK